MESRAAWVLPKELRELGETGLIGEILADFTTDTAQRLAKVRAALAAGDRAALKDQAHSVKGSAAQAGAHAVEALCRSLESGALTAAPLELHEEVRRLELAFDEAVRAIQAFEKQTPL